MSASYKCFICNRRVRNTKFPYNLMLWLPHPKACWVFSDELNSTIFFVVCPKDGDWVNKNLDAAEVIVMAKIKAFEKENEKS